MSYDQTFEGKFTFADEHCLEAGLDRFAAAADDSIVDLDALEVDGLEVTVDMDCSAPASTYDSTITALAELGAEAKSGSVTATFTMDSTERERIGCGRRSNSAGLPERHRHWDLFFAARRGDAARLRELAAEGVALAQLFDHYHGWSPLHLAARSGVAEAVKELLGAGIEVDVASPSGTTPLSLAGSVEAARRLLDAGADKDRVIQGSVPLAIALGDDRLDVADVLLEAGARLPESARRHVVDICARRGQLGALQALAKHDPSVRELFADAEVMNSAISSGDSVLVDFLLDHGASLPEDFVSAAVRSGSIAVTEAALRMPGALERCGSSSGYDDAMCIAASNADLPMMQLLAQHGVPVSPDEPGKTSPLLNLARSPIEGAEACVNWLLDQGADIEAADENGNKPLKEAATYSHNALAKLLLERGADPSAS